MYKNMKAVKKTDFRQQETIQNNGKFTEIPGSDLGKSYGLYSFSCGRRRNQL